MDMKELEQRIAALELEAEKAKAYRDCINIMSTYSYYHSASRCSGRAIFATLVSGDFRQFRSEENRQWFSISDSVQTVDGAVNASEPVLPAWIA